VTPAWQHTERRLEKFDDFELHHILRRDSEVVDALTWLGSSGEPPPLSVFTQDLFKPSIQLEEDVSAPAPRTSLGEDSSAPTPGTPSGKCGVAPAFEADLGASAGPFGQGWEPRQEIAAIVRPPGPNIDWWIPIFVYLRLGTMTEDETENKCLACRAKGYLIHNDELYRHNTSSILQWCIPAEEGKALLLDIHEGVCGHHASSRSIDRKAFRQVFFGR
jgi:hypothetical protein